jgi:hypothetical protein
VPSFTAQSTRAEGKVRMEEKQTLEKKLCNPVQRRSVKRSKQPEHQIYKILHGNLG